MTKSGKLNASIFEGATINTPSMLALEDYLDALNWAREVGGLKGLIARSDANAAAIADWVEATDWVDHLAASADIRSTTSVCLKIVDPWFASLNEAAQRDVQKQIVALLEAEKAGYDIGAYRDAPRACGCGRAQPLKPQIYRRSFPGWTGRLKK